MILVERHIIQANHRFYCEIDRLSFLSKNLYNLANYLIRQSFIFEKTYRPYPELQKTLQQSDSYQALPAKVSQQILMVLDRNCGKCGLGISPSRAIFQDRRSFLAANQVYQDQPEKFLGRPKLPGYKKKETGRNLLVYTMQALSKRQLKQGIIHPSQTEIYLKTRVETSKIKQVRIIPRLNHYVIEVIYEAEPSQYELAPNLFASIDIGLNNLATLTFNQAGLKPVLINSRPLKSLNQYYNKIKEDLLSKIPLLGKVALDGDRQDRALPQNQSSIRLKKLCNKREFKINDYLHKASRLIINTLTEHRIGTLIIGKNQEWKQKINCGKKTNQNFVQIPHAQLIEMLSYKAQMVGIKVILTEESYTSKASFIDNDPIPVYILGEKNLSIFSEHRMKRGLYRTKGGRLVNADVNGFLNIMRKIVPNAFSYGIEEPVRWAGSPT